MERVITAMLVLSTFSAVEERLTEVLRARFRSFDPKIVDKLTIGTYSAVPPVCLAIATHANLFDLLRDSTLFFKVYLTDYSAPTWSLYSCVGYLAMGLATTLGSKFWHDLVMGLINLRGKVRAETATIRLAQSKAAR